ncbi:MAG: D-lactate dehydrogenase [Solirubrobacteraceae bacterium]|nr:D-lactate dehydrogenase [Solirubrobacteraceae bacterium]
MTRTTRGLAPDPQPCSDAAPAWVAGGTPLALRQALTEVLGPAGVLSSALDLVKYASDASPYRLIPQVVAVPRDTGQAAALMAWCDRTATSLTFRAGGTSLNGQGQSDSVLVDVRRHFASVRIEDAGRRARVGPGMVLGHVNRLLARHGRKLGPDPASTDIACVGGVIANNSGGMRCGVHADSYQTLRSMTFVLANGAIIDTAAPHAEQRFARAAPALAAGLAEIRDQIRADAELAGRIAHKFEIKNTTGYRLCAFLDADEPVEIFRRLIVGSEGTLAFVSEAVFETVPYGRHASVALLMFEDLDAATDAVGPLVDSGAAATELMVAPTLIAAAWNMPGVPAEWKELPPTAAALLVEYRAGEVDGLDAPEAAAMMLLRGRPLLQAPAFSREPERIEMLWRVREGMQGLLAAMRAPGVSLILEDVCVPPARVAESARDLQALLSQHGFLPGVAGHASAGNLHFVLTPNFGESADLERYEAFMADLVDLIVDKYDGSLKAEHGTGRNMAPFVEREWGAAATELMWRVTALADPHGVLNPGVVLNRDPQVHVRDLKSTPEIEAVATKCIECGFCEPVCPSRNVTTTPRQRIVVRREMARQPPGSPVLEALLEQYGYEAIETCAADGSCRHACPVAIDTGELVKALRAAAHRPRTERVAGVAADHYAIVERAARTALGAGGAAAGVLGEGAVAALPGALRRAAGAEHVPVWNRSTPQPAPRHLPFTLREGAAAVYLPACINRMFGNPRERPSHPTLPEALVAISQRAGLPLWIPEDVVGVCCGTPWSSKGFADGHTRAQARSAAALARWTDGGRLRVVIDASSCTHALHGEGTPAGVEVLDSIDWVHDELLGRLTLGRKLQRVAVHPTCASRHLGISDKLTAIAGALAEEVIVPAATSCCGMAGDRGWLHPELPASALRDVAAELDGERLDACLSSNRTCEAALSEVTGRTYTSFVLALEELTRS